MLVLSLPMKNRKSWLVTYLTVLPHMAALFMKSQTQTAQQKKKAKKKAVLTKKKRKKQYSLSVFETSKR